MWNVGTECLVSFLSEQCILVGKSLFCQNTQHTTSSSRTNVGYLSTQENVTIHCELEFTYLNRAQTWETIVHKIEASTKSEGVVGVVVDDDDLMMTICQ